MAKPEKREQVDPIALWREGDTADIRKGCVIIVFSSDLLMKSPRREFSAKAVKC
jgi:hypothetical protein